MTQHDLDLTITKISNRNRAVGGSWVQGRINNEYRFDALVFADHAESEDYELGRSKISKLWIERLVDRRVMFNFDKAPATKPEAPRSAPIPVPVSLDNGVPIPGSLITREYKGRLLEVLVLDEGFEYAGEKFKSLSAVAKRITGSHCNGYLFFNLSRRGDR